MGYSRLDNRELQRRCGHPVGALCKRAGDCARFQTAPTGCFRPGQKCFAIWRSRTTEGAAFSPTPKMGVIGAQFKIGQDRLILTLMGSREPGRRGFKPRLRGVSAQAKNVSRSGDRELQKRGKIAQAKMFRDQVFIC